MEVPNNNRPLLMIARQIGVIRWSRLVQIIPDNHVEVSENKFGADFQCA